MMGMPPKSVAKKMAVKAAKKATPLNLVRKVMPAAVAAKKTPARRPKTTSEVRDISPEQLKTLKSHIAIIRIPSKSDFIGVWFNVKTNEGVMAQRSMLNSWARNVDYNNRPQGDTWSLESIARNYDKLMIDFGNDFENMTVEVAAIFKAADAIKAASIARIHESIKAGQIEFEDLPFYYVAGMKVTWNEENDPIAGEVISSKVISTMFGQYLEIKTKILHQFGMKPTFGIKATSIGGYMGKKNLTELPVKEITEAMMATLIERGKTFREITSTRIFNSYIGNLIQRTYWSKNSFRSDGRVMVDAQMAFRMANDTVSNVARQHRITALSGQDMDEDDEDSSDDKPHLTIADDVLYMTYPIVIGFSFANKRWGEMRVASMTPVLWRDSSFDQLVLDQKTKTMVKALVENHGESFGDIVEGKGGGVIFLLHGEPGQGKTLTAESVAELLHRPLYSVSIGELGVEPMQLEKSLREILDVATAWDAVLLLDEADIFLEERDEKDILRNAMVGVFLRLLEYHQGVLFLTTNRVKNIDNAFFSRISIGIKFGAADDSKRLKIWTNLIDAAKLSNVLTANDLQRLSAKDLNGRQIKNIIRVTQTLAKSQNVAPDLERFEEVIDIVTRFKEDLK